MRTFKCAVVGIAAAALALAGADAARAADPPKFKSANQAYRKGLNAYRTGAFERALTALKYAANEGVLGAQLKLVEIYQKGEGVEESEVKAFQITQQIADQYAEMNPRHPAARFVSGAFITLGQYYARGIGELKVEADLKITANLYGHAASYFGDPQAQYLLAKMYLLGNGVRRNPRLAVNWLANAVKKNHAASQALLGDWLWRGANGLKRHPLMGLALMEIARLNAGEGDDAGWINDLYARAESQALPAQRESARRFSRRWRGARPAGQDVSAVLPALETVNTKSR